MMHSFLFLMQAVPGVGRRIPGVPLEYIPSQGMEQAVELHARMITNAWWLLGGLLVVSGGMVVMGLAAKVDISSQELLSRAVLTIFLLVGLNTIFGGVMATGNLLATRIMSEEEISRLNEEFRRAAEETNEQEQLGGASHSWFRRLASLSMLLNPSTALLTEIMMGLATILFYASSILINLLWRVFVVILYIFAPLAIVLGSVPRWGGRVLSAWFGAVVQISAWQIWMAICAWFVRTGDSIFQAHYNLAANGPLGTDNVNHFESIGIAFVFSVMYLATPFLVSYLLPISKFGALATSGTTAAVNSVVSSATTVVQAGTNTFTRTGGGGGGGGQ